MENLSTSRAVSAVVSRLARHRVIMLKLLILLSIPLLIGSCISRGNSSTPQAPQMRVREFEGVYEFVSETTTLSKPERRSEERTSEQWSGMWFFQGNHYSQTMMSKRRAWPPFPRNLQELGYQSSAGEYEIKGSVLELRPSLSLSPLGLLQSKTVEYKLEEDTLTLIETMTPRMENLAEGQRVTVLRRAR